MNDLLCWKGCSWSSRRIVKSIEFHSVSVGLLFATVLFRKGTLRIPSKLCSRSSEEKPRNTSIPIATPRSGPWTAQRSVTVGSSKEGDETTFVVDG